MKERILVPVKKESLPVKKEAALKIRDQWTFNVRDVAGDFDRHVREQLPWYDLATRMVAHIARHYLPQGGLVIDVGCATGNIGRALETMLEARGGRLVSVDAAEEMSANYKGPGQVVVGDVCDFDFALYKPDVIVCFLTLMFVPVKKRAVLIERMRKSLQAGGALIIFDKMAAGSGYLSTMLYRLTLIAKREAGAEASDIMAKDLSLAGVQRPMSEDELAGFVPVFRFGDFGGYVAEG